MPPLAATYRTTKPVQECEAPLPHRGCACPALQAVGDDSRLRAFFVDNTLSTGLLFGCRGATPLLEEPLGEAGHPPGRDATDWVVCQQLVQRAAARHGASALNVTAP